MRHCMMNNRKANNYNIKTENMDIGEFPPLPPISSVYGEPAPYASAAGPVIVSPDMNAGVMPDVMENMPVPANMFTAEIGGTFSVEGMPSPCGADYLAEFLKSQTGKLAKVEFLLGTSTYVERTGVLKEIGTNYLMLNELGTRNMLTCDLYSVKFVTIYAAPAVEFSNGCCMNTRMM